MAKLSIKKLSHPAIEALSVIHHLLGEALSEGPKSPPKVAAKAEPEPKPPAKTPRKTPAKQPAAPKTEAAPLTKKQQKVADYLAGKEYDASMLRGVCSYLDMEGVTPRQRVAKSADMLARNATIKEIKEAVAEISDE